ncbi:MAG: 50S ribosomal protein L10 [Eubacteriales bacterium]
MPNATILETKKALVAELSGKMKSASSGVLVDYKGITVEEDTALRVELRKNNIEYSVVKNTLTRFAAKDAGLEGLSDCLHGTTSLALGTEEDPIAPLRVINSFSKKFNGEKFTIKAGFMDGEILPIDQVLAIAELPAKEVLQAKALGTLLAPISCLAVVIKQIAEQKGGFVEATATEAAPEAATEAPAEEAAE